MDAGMIIGCVIEFAAGLLCVIIGLQIWLKQKVSLLHDYHYRNVKEADLPAYTRAMGIGLVVIGAGVCIAGVLNLFESSLWWVSMLAGFVIGLIIIFRTQKKYNGSVMS